MLSIEALLRRCSGVVKMLGMSLRFSLSVCLFVYKSICVQLEGVYFVLFFKTFEVEDFCLKPLNLFPYKKWDA